MIFFSTLLRLSVFDSEGRRLGVLHDVCVSLNETFPVVTALVVRSTLSNTTMIIPWPQINSLEEPQIHVNVKQSQIGTYVPQPDELLLRRDILDKQIVDTQGFRVVKVNDLQLAQIKKTVRLVGVDISLSGLLRRLGILKPIEVMSHVLPIHLSERTITWNYVEPIQVIKAGTATGQLALAGPPGAAASVSTGGIVSQVQLNVSHNKLADLRPADIADILEQLDAEEASAMLERLDTETAADALNEVESPLQYSILSELDPERASDLLETLAPDDAADILADLPEEVAERLLNLMPIAESRPIRELLRYGAETAGGIMTNEVLSLAQDMTVEEALVYLRQHSEHMEMVYYLFIVDAEQHLAGVVSLRELVVAEPTTHLKDLINPDVIKVTTGMDQEQVAQIIAKYDLLGVPVVDTNNRLVGLVTVDDVIDVIHEEQAEDFSDIAGTSVEEFEEEEHFSWRATLNRVLWLSVNLVAGFIVALILNQLLGPILTTGHGPILTGLTAGLRSHVALNGIVCLVPMLLFTSGSVGSQALGVAGWQLRSTGGSDFWRGMFRELRLGTVGGLLATIVVGLIAWLLFHSLPLGIAIGLGCGFTLLIAAICGLSLPTLFQRLRLRGSLVSAPLLDPIIAVISLSIFLLVALWLINMLHVA
ncbi:MAG TPA: magnesium transporter [Ktedonobacteraceae bacterium]|nr:magnesium transporter [Ktedonobacteraceae bacterium]